MKLLSAYFKRLLTSPLLYFSVLGTAAICFFGAYTEGNTSVIMSFNNALFINSYRNMIVLLAALPFSAVYCREWNEKSSYYVVVRTSPVESIITYIVVQVTAAFLVTFLGMMLSVAILCITLPELVDTSYVYTGTFTQFINKEQGALYVLILIFHYSVSVSAWSVSGLVISAIFMNPYIAICSPLVISYILELFTIGTGKYTDLWTLSISFSTVSESPFLSSAYICMVFIFIGTIFSLLFSIIAGRRIRCEIT